MSELIRTKEYRAWAHAKGRCYNPNDPRYRLYGAKGITMCDRWKDSFLNFKEDMGLAPDKSYTLERKRGDDGYNPLNCIWAPRKVQANNVSTNVVVNYNGARFTLSQLADHVGVKYKSLHHYFTTRGLALEVALEKATKLGEKRLCGQRRFYTADISSINRRIALKRWEGGVSEWGR